MKCESKQEDEKEKKLLLSYIKGCVLKEIEQAQILNGTWFLFDESLLMVIIVIWLKWR